MDAAYPVRRPADQLAARGLRQVRHSQLQILNGHVFLAAFANDHHLHQNTLQMLERMRWKTVISTMKKSRC